jgi:transaldolase
MRRYDGRLADSDGEDSEPNRRLPVAPASPADAAAAPVVRQRERVYTREASIERSACLAVAARCSAGRGPAEVPMTTKLQDLKVKLFTDGADKAQILDMAQKLWIKGFTTNPSLLRKAGVTDYEAYGRDLTAAVPDRHISFEVFSDDIPEMVAQARLIAQWGPNVYVKLPVTTTRGEPLYEAVRSLSDDGVKVNVTAIFTDEQVARTVDALAGRAPCCVSVFAGRLADLGIDYRPIMERAVAKACATNNAEIIWASTREVFNVVEADAMGCHIITAPADVLKKLPALGSRNGAELSLDAVRLFREDALAAKLSLDLASSRRAAE